MFGFCVFFDKKYANYSISENICAQVFVVGDVFNTGDVKVDTDLIVNAGHDGTHPLNMGVFGNQAETGKKLDVTGSLVLHSISWDLNNATYTKIAQPKDSDGIFVSNPGIDDATNGRNPLLSR